MSTITKEWLQHKISDMEATRDEIPFGLDEDDSNTLAALRIALASLETEDKLSSLVASQESLGGDFEKILAENIEELYVPGSSVQPPPVSVPDLKPVGFLFVADDGAVVYSPADWPVEGFNLIGQIYGDVNACSAAMFQGADGNSPVIGEGRIDEAI